MVHARHPSQPPSPVASELPLVLVVDDDFHNRELLKAFLEPSFRVVEAEDGPAALERVQHTAVDLVLLDIMMPGMSGFDVCVRLKDWAGTTFLPVVLLTALSAQDDRNRGLSAGADDFLTKPVNRQELLLRVRAFLRMRRQEAVIRKQVEDLRKLQALKDDLVSLIIHDLRNPLTGVDGYLQLLESLAAAPEHAALLPDITSAREATARLEAILDDVLRVRALEDGKLPLQRSTVALGPLVGDAVATLDGLARAKGIQVQRDLPAGVEAGVDAPLLRRCLENLLSNALKFSPPSRPVEVRVRAQDGAVTVEVADHGPGVPDGLKEEVFTKYGSVPARPADGQRGFGLGLYLVRLVAEAHGGSAHVLDRPGGGAVFQLHLPAGT